MVNVEIDGRKIQAREGAMVIEAADDAGIYIPRFCYHKKLSIAANCRMCLVEIEKLAKEVPACATPVTDGMKVFTRSPKAIAAQKSVMEFLLINHPLDCPICDQGGECELQDIAMGYGGDVSAFTERKRVVENKDFGPLITGDMTRCIHCTRCIRFGEEVAGIKELGATGRGEHMEIGTYIKHSLVSEMSGNIIDLCPVGALTSKPFRFKARAWEIIQRESVAAHDCVGSNLQLHVFRNEVIRVVPRENEAINETWLSDRDRFSYEGLNSESRLTTPMIKTNGEWEETDWTTALQRVASGLQAIINEDGADNIAALASPSSTLEELFLLQKLMRALGSGNIDHRLMQTDFTDQEHAPVFPFLGQAIAELESADAVLLVGSNIRHDQPIVGHRLRKASMQDAVISCINPVDYDFNFPLETRLIVKPSRMPVELAGVLKALAAQTSGKLPKEFDELLGKIDITDDHKSIALQLSDAEQASILMGRDVTTHANSSLIRALVQQISELSGATFGYLTEGSNTAGAWLAGAVPHRDPLGEKASVQGKSVSEMWDSDLAAYILLGVEPEYDTAESNKALTALQAAKFVVVLNTFVNDNAMDYADVILPVAPFTETSGTFVNAEGRWQSFEGVVEPKGDARPAWKVLRVLGNLLDCEGFEYIHSQEVRNELGNQPETTQLDNRMAWKNPDFQFSVITGVEAIIDRPMYCGDAIQRHADSLQKADSLNHFSLRLNAALASTQGISDGDQVLVSNGQIEMTLPVITDRRIPADSVLIPANVFGTGIANPDQNALSLKLC